MRNDTQMPRRLTPADQQFEASQQQLLAALAAEAAFATKVESEFKQAGIKTPVSKVLPPTALSNILNDPQVAEALKLMKSNNAVLGTSDFTPAMIRKVYGAALSHAQTVTGVPSAILVGQIWTESKGNPLVANGGLGQIDFVAFGQMAERAPGMRNRYFPADNILAMAMYLKSMNSGRTPTQLAAWTGALTRYATDPGYVTKVLSHTA